MSETIKQTNRLLAALPAKEYARLLPKLEEISLAYAETIYEPGDIIRHVYFPNSGVVSLLMRVAEGETLEVGVVGNEGIVGLPVFLGVETSSNHVVVQGDGTALRIKTEDFLKECGRGGSLPKLLQRYTHSLLIQVSQTVVCTRFHLIEARLICLLLMMHDRMKTDTFKMTQEILSKMLGVRREAVNKSATNLQQNGLISYSRGNVSILNRALLTGKDWKKPSASVTKSSIPNTTVCSAEVFRELSANAGELMCSIVIFAIHFGSFHIKHSTLRLV